MLAYAIALGAATLIPLVTRGSYVRLVMAPWRWAGLLLGGFAIQLFLEYADIPESRWHDLGFGLLVASYVLLLGFCFGNLIMKGMTVVMIGVACNAVVIAANQGMPVDVPPDWEQSGWIEPTIKHHPQESDDDLMFLADIIVLRSPFDIVISFGDLILAVGLVDVAFHASRRPRRRRTTEPAPPVKTATARTHRRRTRRGAQGERGLDAAIDLALLDLTAPDSGQRETRRERTVRSSATSARGS